MANYKFKQTDISAAASSATRKFSFLEMKPEQRRVTNAEPVGSRIADVAAGSTRVKISLNVGKTWLEDALLNRLLLVATGTG